MTYRDDLDAAHRQIDSLQQEIERLKEKKVPRDFTGLKKAVKASLITVLLIGVFTGGFSGIYLGCDGCRIRYQKFLSLCKKTAPKGSWGHQANAEHTDCNGEDSDHTCTYLLKQPLNNNPKVVIPTRHSFVIPKEAITE